MRHNNRRRTLCRKNGLYFQIHLARLSLGPDPERMHISQVMLVRARRLVRGARFCLLASAVAVAIAEGVERQLHLVELTVCRYIEVVLEAPPNAPWL